MTTREKILLGLLIFAIMYYLLGPPKTFSLFGFTWENQKLECPPINCNVPDTTTTIYPLHEPEQVYAKDALSIENLKARQQIYALNDVATVDFKVVDDRNFPYNFTVNWFYNNSLLTYWYNESNVTWPTWSYYRITQKGEWKAQVVLRWSYNNLSYSKDAITSFEVS